MRTLEQIRADLYEQSVRDVGRAAGRLFFALMLAQWAAAVLYALATTPYTWVGSERSLHPHVLVALALGCAINVLPLALLVRRPGWWLTRHAVAIAQMLWSALWIHLSDGRIEMHFHIFVSLAFLAIYQDWHVLVTAALVVLFDHLARGLYWPESVYGVGDPEWWRFLEHGAWVVFEGAVLVVSCVRATANAQRVAEREAALEVLNRDIECKISMRTAELTSANACLASEMHSRLAIEAELRQAQKLESVGRLAAGVAHEINTPIQFIGDSVGFVRDAMPDLFELVTLAATVRKSVLDGTPSREAAQCSAEREDAADLPYLIERVPRALARALEGLERVAVIVRAMREFAYPDHGEPSSVDLNRSLESTLIIAANEYKYVAQVERDFGVLPLVQCYPGELNQVFLNLIVNAAHAIADVVRGSQQKGLIRVVTRTEGDQVVVSITDNGTGIPAEIRERVFDPFFTTKEIGKGTGQGLAIARSVVVDKHGGKLELSSEVGVGTTFAIRLPIAGSKRGELTASKAPPLTSAKPPPNTHA